MASISFSHFLTGLADRIAHSADISVCHCRRLMAEQVAQDMRADARGCRPSSSPSAAGHAISHVLYAGSGGDLDKVLSHRAIGNSRIVPVLVNAQSY